MTRPLCKHCQKPYTPRYFGRKYCSKKCSKNYIGWSKGKVFTKYEILCEICSKPFFTTPSNKHQYTCSLACRTKRQKQKPTWVKVRKCKYCTKDFTAKKDSIIYCSRICGARQRSENLKSLRPTVLRLDKSGRVKARERLGNRCQRCGWYREPGILEIHHRDRNSYNNELKNLELLCPNCHSLEHFKDRDGNYPFKQKA